jgi:hypothetical protein
MLATAPTAGKVLSASLAMLEFGILAFSLGLDVGAANFDRVGSPGLGLLFALILLGVFPANVVLLTTLFRTGAWLEGTTLAVCDGFRTQRRDLATARLSFGSFLGRPCLLARDNVTGRKARLVLNRLSAAELFQLIGAITASGRQDADGWLVVAGLRQRVGSQYGVLPGGRVPPGAPMPPGGGMPPSGGMPPGAYPPR